MKVTIKDGKLIIEIDIESPMPLSKKGNSRFVATTSGFAKTDLKVDGKTVSINLMAIVPEGK